MVKGRGFVLKNLKKFQQRGIDIDTIAMNCYRIETKHDLEVQCAEMRILGVNLTTIFVMANQLLVKESLNPASIYCLLHFFYQQNLSPGLIAAWIKDHLTEKILDSIIAADPLDWTIFGINLDDYRPIWVTGKFLRFFSLEPDFKKLPPTITITQFLSYLNIQQIYIATLGVIFINLRILSRIISHLVEQLIYWLINMNMKISISSVQKRIYFKLALSCLNMVPPILIEKIS